MPEEVIVEIPVDPGKGECDMAASAEENIMQTVLSGMAADAAGAAATRTRRFDQLSADSASMWAAALTMPTVNMGMGFRVAQQSGGWPADSGTGTGGGK